MAVVGFSSNIASLQAQRRLGLSSSKLTSSFEHLSTGLRIVRASDDAAGLAISDQLRVNTRLYGAAIRNINDGASLLNVASGVVEQQINILTRLRELAQQSANGTLGASQRSALNAEYQVLVDESGRLADTARFNGIDLLRGSRGNSGSTLRIQSGITGDGNSQLRLTAADTGSYAGVVDLNGAATDGGLSPILNSTTFASINSTYGNNIAQIEVTDNAGNKRTLLAAFSISNAASETLRVNFYQRVSDTGGVGAQTAAGVVGTVTSASHEWVFAGSTIALNSANNGYLSPPNIAVAVSFQNQSVGGTALLDLSATKFTDSSGGGAGDLALPLTLNDPGTAIDFTGVETSTRALNALAVTGRRMADLDAVLGEIGALQSRLEKAASVNESASINTAEAESRIRDVDVAEESSRLASAQILQQGAASVLSSANLQPQLLLDLLR